MTESGRERMCVSGATAGYPGCCNRSCYIRAGGTETKKPDAPDLQDRPSAGRARRLGISTPQGAFSDAHGRKVLLLEVALRE